MELTQNLKSFVHLTTPHQLFFYDGHSNILIIFHLGESYRKLFPDSNVSPGISNRPVRMSMFLPRFNQVVRIVYHCTPTFGFQALTWLEDVGLSFTGTGLWSQQFEPPLRGWSERRRRGGQSSSCREPSPYCQPPGTQSTGADPWLECQQGPCQVSLNSAYI